MAKKRRGEGTKFQIDRKLFSSWIWVKGSPLQRNLIVWLIGNVNYKKNAFKGKTIKRGEIVRSYRNIAKALAYYKGYCKITPSTSSIARILRTFKKHEVIETRPLQNSKDKRTEHVGYIIKLLKFDKLQTFETTNGTPNRTESKKDSTIYSLFEFWNSLKIITHKKIDKFVSPLETALKDYSGFQIRKAMANYSTVTKGKEYFFNYRWTLKEFLTRVGGLEKFLDINTPLENFLIDKEDKTKQVYPKYEEKK